MTESNKTLTYLAVAAVACMAAYISQPQSAEFDAEDEVGKQLTKEFAAEDARRMKITRFDEDAASLSAFEVAQVGRLWSIPSKGGYPADGEEQMAKAVDGVRGREILSVASKSAEDHQQYGVVDPTNPKLEVGQTGVGTRVTLEDESGDALVDLVIGEEVKDADGLHYVRRADQDFVYVVQIDPKDFSTTFEQWIQDDLLNISPWDILEVRLNDYSAEMVPTNGGLAIDPQYRTDITLRYNDADSKWEVVSLEEATDPRTGAFKPFKLAEDQELNKDKLSDMKNALDDLRIVDVAKKPAGLSADLKAGDALRKDFETIISLVNRGFAPMENGEMISTNGEVICTMKNGVEYVLRFGDPQLETTDQKPADEQGEQDNPDEMQGLNRYLFVMARFNEDVIEKPELEEVPALPEVGADEKSENDSAEDLSDEAADATGAQDTQDTAERQADAEDADSEPAEAGEEDPESDSDAEESAEQPSTEDLIAQRKEVEQRNQQKLDEYADDIKAGKQTVAELNERFGDWYYVIPGEEFNKIHLSRADVIKQKDKPEGEEEEDAADAGPLGAPGSAIPGLPDLGGVGDADAPVVEEAAEGSSDGDEAVEIEIEQPADASSAEKSATAE